MTKAEKARFEVLCEKEPYLATLLAQARAVHDDTSKPSFCANHVWVDVLKPQLLELVGWEARNPELRTSEAYDLAYDVIYEALPACRNCGCYGMGRIASGARRGTSWDAGTGNRP
jgi:hypothetical protein